MKTAFASIIQGLFAFLALIPLAVLAAEDKPASAAKIFDTAYLLQVFGSLLLVFGCIFVLIFVLKKMNGLPMASNAPIRVLGSARVGTREKIILLEAGKQQLLVGVTPGSIRTLHTFEEPVIDTSSQTVKGEAFASLLKKSFGGKPE